METRILEFLSRLLILQNIKDLSEVVVEVEKPLFTKC